MARRVSPAGVVVLAVAGVAVGALAWDRFIKPHVVPKRFHEVAAATIYRSGKLTPATMEQVVRSHDIRTIVDLGAWVDDPRGERLEARTADVLGVQRHTFDLVGDSTGDPNDYVEALRLMTDPANQPVLVHCGAGTERTGMLVYLYRRIVEGATPEDAMREARRIGHSPSRNPHMAQMIERWEPEITRAFRDGGTIRVDAPTAQNDPAPEASPVQSSPGGATPSEPEGATPSPGAGQTADPPASPG
ncbi:MAG: tyrosine-protein phosphatase [Phycisphaerales bacterium]|nr:tyrosine-protein phosphatase [Phycisphaerales bacterium]